MNFTIVTINSTQTLVTIANMVIRYCKLLYVQSLFLHGILIHHNSQSTVLTTHTPNNHHVCLPGAPEPAAGLAAAREQGQHALLHPAHHRDERPPAAAAPPAARQELQTRHPVVPAEEEDEPGLLAQRPRQVQPRRRAGQQQVGESSPADPVDREPQEHTQELGRELPRQRGHMQARHRRLGARLQEDLRHGVHLAMRHVLVPPKPVALDWHRIEE